MNEKWLAHLSPEVTVGARNNNLCSYLIALEGWRRGLTLKFYSKRVKQDSLHAPGLLFSLSDGLDTHTFYKSRGMRVKREAFTIGGDKFKIKELLSKNDIPVAQGENFTKDSTNEVIIDYANKLGYPVVVKPSNAAQGKGVIANIDNESRLVEALKYVREELDYKQVILEKSVTGDEFRIYVMEDEVIAVMNRVPANVIGDGEHSIRELIKIKNKERRKNPRLSSCLIKIDFEIESMIKENNYTLNTILKKGEQFFLREKSNISTGGDSIDFTDQFPDHFKKIAINALKQVPNFPNGGVDMMVDFSKEIDKAAHVIELTPVPQIGGLIFPMEGKARDVPSAIIDSYFPETKQKKNSNPNIYFDLRDVLAPLYSKSAEEITVTKCPENLFYAKRYVLSGKIIKGKFTRWVRKKALEMDLFGHVQELNNDKIEIMVSGSEEKVDEFKEICEYGPQNSTLSVVEEGYWTKPIKIGFEIKPRQKPKPKPKLQKNNEENTYNTPKKPPVFQRILNKLNRRRKAN